MTGNSGNNILNGGAGNDNLTGGAGADTLIGGTGDDTYIVDNPGDKVTEALNSGIDKVQSTVTYTLAANVENLTLTGSANLNGTGNALSNTITGNSGNNTLNGGTGADNLIGGAGNDTYIVDNVGDKITEALNSGIDKVQSSLSYSLGANLENLTLTGTANLSGIGNTLANTITGNSGNNTLNGGTGADNLIGGTGNDTYIVDNLGDKITENLNSGIDKVQSSVTYALPANVENLTLLGSANLNGTGNTLSNTITGNSGNNTLNGGAGADSLIGGTGNDTYIIDNVGDKITEALNSGIDKVQSSVTYALPANVENLTLLGSANLNGTGNTLANTITGNSGNNILNGGTGADSLIGGTGNDTYIIDNLGDKITEALNSGIDKVQSTVTYTLPANVENLTLLGSANLNGTGNALANTITGNSGNNILNGGAGADSLIGGTGNDTYIVDNLGDKITEALNSGIDKVQSSLSYSLGANLENLTLTGTANLSGTGNTLSNTITGNSGNNTLNGGVGADTLIGGAGNDTLIGGAGKDSLTGGMAADKFNYKTLTDSLLANYDIITDFNAAGIDKFLVTTASAGFTDAGAVASLDSAGITAKLTTANFAANFAAKFTFGSRTFVAINDGVAGFNATADAIVEVTGLTGTLDLNDFIV